MSISLLRRLLMKEAVKDTAGSSGIMSINKNIANKVEQQVQKYVNDAMQQGVDLDTLSPEQLKMIVQMNKPQPPRVIAADSPEGRGITERLFGKQGEVVDMAGKKLDTSQGIMGGKSVKELMDSGQVSKGARGMKKSKKVQDREMFKAANERLKTDAEIKAEIEAGNKKGIAGIKNKRQLTEDKYQDFLDEVGGADQLEAYDFDGTVGDAKRIVKEQKDYMSQMEMEFRKGKLDPEPGSRTPQRKRFLQKKLEEAEASGDARLLSREEREELFDLDDIPEYATGGIARANFVGGGMGRRGFLKMLAGLGGGIAAAKTGLLKLAGKEPAKQVAKEVVQKSTTTPPPYFFKLAEKIKMMGDDATATTDRTIAKTLKSKDGKSTYVLEEDVATGDTIIKKVNKEGDEMMTDVEIMELKKGEVVMGKDGRPVKVPDEYEEVTEVNARIEGDVFNDPYYSDGIKIDEIMKEVGEQAPSIKKASGGIARFGYQVGGDVSYDATDPIYGSSAATFTPNTVMDQFGNQVQAEMGNNFNKPLIPQVTEQASKQEGIMNSSPIVSQADGTGEIDMPIAGGNNNAAGILPVMPKDEEIFTKQPVEGEGSVVGNYNDPLPKDQLLSGFEEYKKTNPPGAGTAAMVPVTLPGGYSHDFSGSAEANAFRKYLESIGQAPYQGRQDPGMLVKFASGGIARMLGE